MINHQIGRAEQVAPPFFYENGYGYHEVDADEATAALVVKITERGPIDSISQKILRAIMERMTRGTEHTKIFMLSLIKTKFKDAILWIATLISVITSTSCVGSGLGEIPPPDRPENPPSVEAFTDSFSSSQNLLTDALAFLEEEAIEVETEDYSIKKEAYYDEHYDIEYPQIKKSAFLTEETISQINNQFYDFSSNWIEVEEEEKPFVTVTTRYKITEANNKILSIYFWGYLSNGVHVTNYEFGMTYDMQLGVTKKVDDFFKKEKIVTAMQNRSFFPTREDDVFWEVYNFVNYQISFEDAMEYTNNFFISDNYIGIIVSVSRPMGDSLLLLCPSNGIAETEVRIPTNSTSPAH